MTARGKYSKVAIIVIPTGVFLASLTQNAFSYQYQGVEMTKSYLLLLMGATAWMGGGLFESMIWLANPMAIVACFRFLKENSAKVKIEPVLKTVIQKPKPISHWLSIVAAAIAWSFSLWDKVLASESGTAGKILSLEPGYWLWISSLTLLAIGINYYHFSVRAKPVM